MELIVCHCIQLQLTYRPEEGPDEDTKLSNDEPESFVPADDVAVSSIETAPPPPPPPQTNMDSGDLLVIFSLEFHNVSYLSTSFFCWLHFGGVQGLNYSAPDAYAIEESNALALAIVPTDYGKLCFLFVLSFPFV